MAEPATPTVGSPSFLMGPGTSAAFVLVALSTPGFAAMETEAAMEIRGSETGVSPTAGGPAWESLEGTASFFTAARPAGLVLSLRLSAGPSAGPVSVGSAVRAFVGLSWSATPALIEAAGVTAATSGGAEGVPASRRPSPIAFLLKTKSGDSAADPGALALRGSSSVALMLGALVLFSRGLQQHIRWARRTQTRQMTANRAPPPPPAAPAMRLIPAPDDSPPWLLALVPELSDSETSPAGGRPRLASSVLTDASMSDTARAWMCSAPAASTATVKVTAVVAALTPIRRTSTREAAGHVAVT
mmetsp:Transcript_52742/g.138686  ORF Transcript_52742/g.138686 Transcript_52742/m.138686 type:complete len:301 (+) Transcript_52742:3699-4601(+)